MSKRTILPTTQEEPWEPDYSHWRHGGWYTDARYPSGACGCVSNNYVDKKWRIACFYFGLTFTTRRDAANAERAMTLALNGAANDQADLVAALKKVLRYCVTVNGMPDKDKGRTEQQQAALDMAAAALKAVNHD